MSELQLTEDLLDRMVRAVEKVRERLGRATSSLAAAGIRRSSPIIPPLPPPTHKAIKHKVPDLIGRAVSGDAAGHAGHLLARSSPGPDRSSPRSKQSSRRECPRWRSAAPRSACGPRSSRRADRSSTTSRPSMCAVGSPSVITMICLFAAGCRNSRFAPAATPREYW